MLPARRFTRWIWATYQTLTLLQWVFALPIGASGLAATPVIGAVAGWPIWVQALLSSIVAILWLTLFTWRVRVMSEQRSGEGRPTQSQSASGAGRDISQWLFRDTLAKLIHADKVPYASLVADVC